MRFGIAVCFISSDNGWIKVCQYGKLTLQCSGRSFDNNGRQQGKIARILFALCRLVHIGIESEQAVAFDGFAVTWPELL